MHELSDGAKGVVVERSHLARIDSPIGEHRIPSLPLPIHQQFGSVLWHKATLTIVVAPIPTEYSHEGLSFSCNIL